MSGPRIPIGTQSAEFVDEVCRFLPELTFRAGDCASKRRLVAARRPLPA
jgi:hypothetical protein